MELRLIELTDMQVYGTACKFDGTEEAAREESRQQMWSCECEDIPHLLCGAWNSVENTAYDGARYGI